MSHTEKFIHLNCHSEYSIADSLVTIEGLMKKLNLQKVKSCALTDRVNLFAAVKFYTACEKAGIKPIIGADIFYVNDFEEVKKRRLKQNQVFRLTLLCQNLEGYRHLTQLISRAYLDGQALDIPCIQKNWLQNKTDGLIALSPFKESDFGNAFMAHQENEAHDFFNDWEALFPQRFYLTICRTGKPQEETIEKKLLGFALEKNCPVVAVNHVRFLEPDDFEAHEARVCIQEGVVLDSPLRDRNYSEEQYLKSPEEMSTLFSDLPEALENSIEIAKRCNLKLTLGKSFLPNFPVPEKLTPETYLSQEAFKQLDVKLQTLDTTKGFSKKDYDARLEMELKVINQMGFAGYFLIVADFIGWAKSQHIPVGPGRGSGAGSLVAYALGITDIDPLPYDLLFERFLNPERVSMPDFDIDFCMDKRDRVIEYVSQKYGRDSVSQIITFGTMAAKAVVRDVGRVLGHPYGFVDKIAKLIPFELGITLDKALQQEEDLKTRYDEEEDVKLLIDLAKKLEGLTRNAGKHAGGVVIAPSKLTDFTPLYCEPESDASHEIHAVSQFDKDDVEKAGLVKFDFLGLRTLTIIGWTVDKINHKKKQLGEPLLQINALALNDPKTFEMIKSCHTTAIFQLESRGMKELIKRLQPDCFEEIVSLVALFRPGPLQSGMVDEFINRKQGKAKVDYPHELLKPVLKSTHGIIVYQEQVAKIAQILAGYTLGQADLLRKAMGKKKPEEMAKQRSIFIAGAQKNNINEALASDIFDKMEKFAEYGFNKSHSVAYAMITYQTAYLKTHYPEEYMAAVLSSDMDKTDKVVNFLEEAKRMQITIVPPDINSSDYSFKATEDKKILYGLGALKGAGFAALSIILENRNQSGSFKDLIDFFTRIDSRKVNKRVLEALIKSGAFDVFQFSRKALLDNLDDILQGSFKKSARQKDLFASDDTEPSQKLLLKSRKEWTILEKLQAEKETLGFYQSGHPLYSYTKELQSIMTHVSEKLSMGIIQQIKTMFTKKGDRMAFVKLECLDKTFEMTLFSELYEKNRQCLVKDNVVLYSGEWSLDEFTGGHKLIVREIYSLQTFREKFAKAVLLKLSDGKLSENIQYLTDLIGSNGSNNKGKCPVFVDIYKSSSKSRFKLGEEWSLHLSDELIQKMLERFGEDQFKVIY